MCGKIIERKPERKECTCLTFVKDQYELDLAIKYELSVRRRREEKVEKMLLTQKHEIIS